MTSSSSTPSNIKIKFGPIDDDVLWMQAKHVSEHVWNEKEDRKLHKMEFLNLTKFQTQNGRVKLKKISDTKIIKKETYK